MEDLECHFYMWIFGSSSKTSPNNGAIEREDALFLLEEDIYRKMKLEERLQSSRTCVSILSNTISQRADLQGKRTKSLKSSKLEQFFGWLQSQGYHFGFCFKILRNFTNINSLYLNYIEAQLIWKAKQTETSKNRSKISYFCTTKINENEGRERAKIPLNSIK